MKLIRFGLHTIKNIRTFFDKANINTKQKLPYLNSSKTYY